MDGVQSHVGIQETSELLKLRLPGAFISDNLHGRTIVCAFLLPALLWRELRMGEDANRTWEKKYRKNPLES